MKRPADTQKHGAPAVVFAMINSNITSIAAELAADLLGDVPMLAISRRGCTTRLPSVENGETLEHRFVPKRRKNSARLIRAFDEYFSNLSGGKPFDVLVCHSSDPLSQMLVTHPLCRCFYYIEEGLTASVGKRLGRKSKSSTYLKRWLWKLKSRVFYQGRIIKYAASFYDTSAPKYCGAYALSKTGFLEFPGRVQLPFQELPPIGEDPHADIVLLLDSQYFIGGCTYEEYKQAVLPCISGVVTPGTRIAVKFHPGERRENRKVDMKDALAAIEGVASVHELGPDFIAERMPYHADTTVIVGTSALGLYMGNRGFKTVTFARRLHSCSKKMADFIDDIPQVFFDVCEEG